MDVTPTPERVASSTDTASRLGSPEPTLKRPAPFADDQEIADVLIEKKRKFPAKYRGIVTVLVGPEEDEFEVHYTRLDQHSAWFRNIRIGKPSDEAPMIVKLPEISKPYFELYLHWIYTSKLDDDALDYVDGAPGFVHTYARFQQAIHEVARQYLWDLIPSVSCTLADHLIKLWIYAGLLGDAACQNIISDELVHWYLNNQDIPTAMSPSTIAFVDEHTTSERPLRQFCIDWIDSESVVASTEHKEGCLGETAPKWLLLGVLSYKMRRESGDWEGEGDPRNASKEGRYWVP